ncbi:MAG: PmoA family protein [Chitinophagaceae bacterium]|nr:PmoA family protein [Chitinophagaceae bacterium]
MQKYLGFLMLLIVSTNGFLLRAQEQSYTIEVKPSPNQKKIIITVGGKPFTEFIYPDSLEKHTLYPIYSPDGQVLTRGFPVNPQPGDPTDHPHHLGLWFNYEKVNGLDFWNNSYNIKADRKHLYGWIRVDSILQTKSGTKGELKVSSSWHNQQKNVLLRETTHFIFTASKDQRMIDRITTLIAVTDTVLFSDVKDGLLGLRVTPELQIPTKEEASFKDDQNNVTKVKANIRSTGNYITSEGKQGDSAWGTRGKWCVLYGTKNNSVISIAIIDHPQNPGYPTYWHARGYGLFAANPLGQKVFSNGKESLNLVLLKNQSVTFRYRIAIAAGKQRLGNATIDALSETFKQ